MKRWIACMATVGAFAALALAGPATADPVTGGKSLLEPDADTLEGFADLTIAVGATGAASDTTKGVVFPVLGGNLRPGPKGQVPQGGGLVFDRNTAEGGTVKFSQFIVVFDGQRAKLFAKSGRTAVRFMDLDLNVISTNATGTRTTIHRAKATLAEEAADVLSETFDFHFRKGIRMGRMTIKLDLG
jgi:hypothetical protein